MAQAWGQTIQALHDVIVLRDLKVLRAGAIPTRDEISAWYAQFSLARLWQDVLVSVHQMPYGARLGAGFALAAFGGVLIWKSYQRATRPSQADVIRRVSKASSGDVWQEATAKPPPASTTNDTPPSEIAPGSARPSAPLRPLMPQAFLTADQFTQGPAPWAVPLAVIQK